MRKMLGALTAAAVLGIATAAYAAQSTGTITNINMMKHSVTLGNGQTFHVAKYVKLGSHKVGQKVTVTYSKYGKTMDAKAIRVAP